MHSFLNSSVVLLTSETEKFVVIHDHNAPCLWLRSGQVWQFVKSYPSVFALVSAIYVFAAASVKVSTANNESNLRSVIRCHVLPVRSDVAWNAQEQNICTPIICLHYFRQLANHSPCVIVGIVGAALLLRVETFTRDYLAICKYTVVIFVIIYTNYLTNLDSKTLKA